MSLVLEDFQREGDVVRGERAAVVERDAGPHEEAVGEPIIRYLHRAGGEAVHGIRLVRGARHQAREGELHALRAIALEDEAVERIEGEKVLIEGAARPDMRKRAALGRIRVHVLEMLEVRRIFEVTERRHAVPLGAFPRQRGPRHRRCKRASGDDERLAACHIAEIRHCRVPALAALSASHHHIVGNAAEAYFGSGSGRPNRSHRAVRLLP